MCWREKDRFLILKRIHYNIYPFFVVFHSNTTKKNVAIQVVNVNTAFGEVTGTSARGELSARKWAWFCAEQLACFLGCDRWCCYFRNHSGSELQPGCWRSFSARLLANQNKKQVNGTWTECPQKPWGSGISVRAIYFSACSLLTHPFSAFNASVAVTRTTSEAVTWQRDKECLQNWPVSSHKKT